MNLRGGGCSEPRLCHCTPPCLVNRARLHLKKNKKQKTLTCPNSFPPAISAYKARLRGFLLSVAQNRKGRSDLHYCPLVPWSILSDVSLQQRCPCPGDPRQCNPAGRHGLLQGPKEREVMKKGGPKKGLH